MPVLVGFCGAAGSGKTTLVRKTARLLSGRGYRVGVIEEIAREVFCEYEKRYGVKNLMDIRNNPELLYGFQKSILSRQVQKERQALASADIVLSDRTVWDALLYSIIWADWDTATRIATEFRSLVKNPGYDIVFLTLAPERVEDDGFRTPDLENTRTEEFLLSRWVPHAIRVPFIPLEERVSIVENEINKTLKERQKRERQRFLGGYHKP